MDFRQYLKGKIPDADLALVPRAFEIVGDIAVLELPKEISKHKNAISDALLNTQKNVRVVLLKTEDVGGKYRVPEYNVLAHRERDFSHTPKWARPEELTETIHNESGARYRIDLAKAYFTSKLSGERVRIAEMVKNRESILVLFAGVGPFAISIAKKRDVKITAIEINPDAVKMFEDNVLLNKAEGKIKVLEGDVGKLLPKLKGKFDRIVMPAPKNAADFLEIALAKAKKGGIVHLYTFAEIEELETLGEKIKQRCLIAKKKVKILDVKKAGEIGPYKYRVAVDIKIS